MVIKTVETTTARKVIERVTEGIKRIKPKMPAISHSKAEEIFNIAKKEIGYGDVKNHEFLKNLKKNPELKNAFLNKLDNVLANNKIAGVKSKDVLSAVSRIEKAKSRTGLLDINAKHLEILDSMFNDITKQAKIGNPYTLIHKHNTNSNFREHLNNLLTKKINSLDDNVKEQKEIKQVLLKHMSEGKDVLSTIINSKTALMTKSQKAHHLATHIIKEGGKYSVSVSAVPVATTITTLAQLPLHALLNTLPGFRETGGLFTSSIANISQHAGGLFRNMSENLANFAEERRNLLNQIESPLASP